MHTPAQLLPSAPRRLPALLRAVLYPLALVVVLLHALATPAAAHTDLDSTNLPMEPPWTCPLKK